MHSLNYPAKQLQHKLPTVIGIIISVQYHIQTTGSTNSLSKKKQMKSVELMGPIMQMQVHPDHSAVQQ